KVDLGDLGVDVLHDFGQRTSRSICFDGHYWICIEVTDLRRPQRLGDRRDLAERQCARVAVRSGYHDWQLLQIGGSLSCLRSETDVDLPHLVARVDPVARLDAGERGTQ